MTQNEQPISMINSHIETYLDYYCRLSHAPGFAVLLKGKWGCGKTWFIDKYRKKLEDKKQKCLYVTLYGITSFSDIEDAFFQQLHPILSSKGMAITGKILKGLLKGTLKIDLDSDAKDEGSVNIQIPEINLPEYLKNTDKSILIFDDVERCKIDIGNLLGYINYFVEHQGLKVILIANEEKLLENDNYKDIKEKLIGKTFDLCLDFQGALKDFIKAINHLTIESFLSNNTKLIEEIYHQAEYENLRILKQIILDFERIFQELPEKARKKSELLQDFLRFFIAFSIEIKRGAMSAKDIIKLESSSETRAISNPVDNDNNQEQNYLEKILIRYGFLNLWLYVPFPSLAWWQAFFDQGIIKTSELEDAISNSKYFQDDNTPNWIRLWHFHDTDISDDEFDDLLKKVESEYAKREFVDLGEIKHITGLFLHLSDSGLYSKNKQDLLQDAKLYIFNLIADNKIGLNLSSPANSSLIKSVIVYKGLNFQGIDLPEFNDFCSYMETEIQSAIERQLPKWGLELLDIMQHDQWQFRRMICLEVGLESKDWDGTYCRIPIFKYIAAEEFANRFLSMNFHDQYVCLQAFTGRYEAIDLSYRLLEELIFLEDIQYFLMEEADRKKGKPSGYRLEFLNTQYLNKAIEKLTTFS